MKDREELAAKLKSYKDINWNSTKQLQEYLFKELQLPILKYTNKGSPSTGVAELKELASYHEVIPLLLKHREVEKAMAFLESWTEEAVEHKDGNFYLHSNFNLHGTVTGRTSSSDVNLQQIPRNKRLKSLFSADHIPGWQLVCLDYSQLELRFAGIVAGVEAIKKAYRNGEDLHYKMAATVTGKPISEITKEERTQAKAANFG
jgi:DNA polymerase-1